MNNLFNPEVKNFIPITAAHHLIAGGAAGYIDTDISADVPAGIAKTVLLIGAPTAAQNVGARGPGEVADPKTGTGAGVVTIIANVSATAHVELYREAANNDYYIQGYWN